MGKHSIKAIGWTRGKYLLAALVVVGALGFGYFAFPMRLKSPVSAASMCTIPNAAPRRATDTTSTWQMKQGDYKNNRWFSDGLREIKDAKTVQEAEAAIAVWVDKVKRDPIVFAGAAEQILGEKIKKEDLVDKDGWATPLAVKTAYRLETEMTMAKVSPSEAPSNGTNSGVSDGQVVQASNSGVGGDRKAIKVEREGKGTFWVLGRCGQIVIIGEMSFPRGVTEKEELIPCPDRVNPKRTQPVQDNPPGMADPTPGYPGRGNAEQVVQQQESEPKGGTEPTPKGTPGDGNPGGSTPEGDADGKKADPPSNDPPDSGYQGETPQQPIPED